MAENFVKQQCYLITRVNLFYLKGKCNAVGKECCIPNIYWQDNNCSNP